MQQTDDPRPETPPAGDSAGAPGDQGGLEDLIGAEEILTRVQELAQ